MIRRGFRRNRRINHELTLIDTKAEVAGQTSRLFVFISGLEIL